MVGSGDLGQWWLGPNMAGRNIFHFHVKGITNKPIRSSFTGTNVFFQCQTPLHHGWMMVQKCSMMVGGAPVIAAPFRLSPTWPHLGPEMWIINSFEVVSVTAASFVYFPFMSKYRNITP